MAQEYPVASLNVLVLPTTLRIISKSLKVKGQMTEGVILAIPPH